jgi:hypothetical protein
VKTKSLLLIAPLLLMLFGFLPRPVLAASPVDDSGLVVLTVTGDNVRIRLVPDVQARVWTRFNTGDVLVAEKWPIKGESMSWYRIVGLVDKDSGRFGSLQSAYLKGFYYYPYISADFVQPYSGGHFEHDLFAQVRDTPYGQGYSMVDASPEAQRRMAEQRLELAFAPSGKTVTVYREPSTASGSVGQFSENNDALVVLDASRPGWLFAVDVEARSQAGWVGSRLLEVSDSKTAGYQAALNLGANIPEILRRWGPGTIAERRVNESWRGNVAHTAISADGFELKYEDYRNFEFTLTRPGSGLGGIFVGVDWCNKEYIEKTFGWLNIDKFKLNSGADRWSLQGSLDGWGFAIHLTFDEQGRVREFTYDCAAVRLNI